jgi:hypothetical protein
VITSTTELHRLKLNGAAVGEEPEIDVDVVLPCGIGVAIGVAGA